MKKFLYLVALFFGTFPIYAQYHFLGLNSPKVEWLEINNDTFRLVFPQSLNSQAQRIANILQQQAQHSGIGTKFKKIPIVLHSQTVTPNGFVAIAPWRSEFYATPPQNNFAGALNWLDLLAIHEYRHVQQNANALRGVTKFFYNILGQGAWGMMTGMALPRWFMEGDAVCTETALSHAGRGRQPSFEMEYKSLFLNQKKYNYEKASAGSFRDFVPNHYVLGYYMTAYARKQFGKDVWEKNLEDAAHFRGIFKPLSYSLRKNIGLNTPKLYQKTILDLDSLFQLQNKNIKIVPQKLLTSYQNYYTAYRFSQQSENGSVIVEKNSFKKIRFLVEIKQNKEKTLTSIGNNDLHNRSLSLHKDWVVWTEQTNHWRWANVEYSVIRAFHLASGKKKKISHKTRYFSPAISEKLQIACISQDDSQKSSLVILDLEGKILQKSLSPLQISFPQWINQEEILVVGQSEKGNALYKFDTKKQVFELIKDFEFEQITYPSVAYPFVYFSGTQTGINNIFALNLESKQLFQITDSPTGAFYPNVDKDNKSLIFSEFSEKGYYLKQISLNDSLFSEVSPKNKANYYDFLVAQEQLNLTENIGNTNFSTKKFKKSSQLFNPHSIFGYAFHPFYSVSLEMDNFFRTFSGSAFTNYNANDQSTQYGFSGAFGQYLSVLRFGFSHTQKNATMSRIFRDAQNENVLAAYTGVWAENKANFGLSFPLDFRHDNFIGLFQADFDYNFLYNDFKDRISNPSRDGFMHTWGTKLTFSHLQNMALRQINPSFGQFFQLYYDKSVFTNYNKGERINLDLDLYFPSIFPTHSLWFSFRFMQQQAIGAYRFTNWFRWARGYAAAPDLPLSAYLQEKVHTWGLNYSMPLFYPDWTLGSLAFVKRFFVNFFYDQTQAQFYTLNDRYRSVGTELNVDMRALRLMELRLGFRFYYLLDRTTGRMGWELFRINVGF